MNPFFPVNTLTLMRGAVGNERVLLEGAQVVLLSYIHGTYPYVTSSDCSLSGLAEGVGLRTEHVDYVLGVVKAPYMSRVGKGPFPTELGGGQSAGWCSTPGATKEVEWETYPHASINATDSFEQGVAIRQAGNEYGATTGRLRRVGWLDLPLLRHAIFHGSKTLALTKVDVMNPCEVIRICIAHRYIGDDYRVGEKLLTQGAILKTAIVDSFVLERCEPVYRDFPGWCCDLSGIRSAAEVPEKLRAIIRFVEKECGVQVDILSVGAERSETIVL